MLTYLLLNLAFLLGGLAFLRRRAWTDLKVRIGALAVLLLLTTLFDNLLVGFHVVGYAHDKLLGLFVGCAPVEDFFYPLLTVFLVPALWDTLGGDDA